MEREQPKRTAWFGVQTKQPAVPVGRIKARFAPPHIRFAVLGMTIADPANWRKGCGSGALLLVIEYCFGWLDMRKVWLGTLGTNDRVHGLMARAGFHQDLRQRDAMIARMRLRDKGHINDA